MGVSGNNLTFRPLSPTVVRKCKDGNVNIINLLFGSNYNIKLDGVITNTINNKVRDSNYTVMTESSLLKLKHESLSLDNAVLTSRFNSFMYFYPKSKIKFHLKLVDTEASTSSVRVFKGNLEFEDLLSEDKLTFELRRVSNITHLDVKETKAGVEKILYTENLGSGVHEYWGEFWYLFNGQCRFYKTNVDNTNKRITNTKLWTGDITALLGECSVSYNSINGDNVLKELHSDYMFIYYKDIYLRYDQELDDKFIGAIKVYDNFNSDIEENWRRIRTRDYKFIGDRVIENGMVRIVIKNLNPVIEVYGYDYENTESWIYCYSILTESDNNRSSLSIQNVAITTFSYDQINLEVNFGTRVYKILMTKGDPYITVSNRYNKKLFIKTGKKNFTFDGENDSWYSLGKDNEIGLVEDQSIVDYRDNWFSLYDPNKSVEVLGWFANVFNPSKFKTTLYNDEYIFEFEYPQTANVFGFGVLVGNTKDKINNVQVAFTVSNIDTYVKWRANESVYAFQEKNVFKRR